MNSPKPSKTQSQKSRRARTRKPWIMIWYTCCSAYGRANRTPDGKRYLGRCPRCGCTVQAIIGPNGTSARMFKTK